MAIIVQTRSAELVAKIISASFKQKAICIASHGTIQEKSILMMFHNVENFSLKKFPVNLYHGTAEKTLLYPCLSYVLDDFFLLPDREKDYVPGSIIAKIIARGKDYAAATKILNLVNTKAAINHAVDISMGMFISEVPSNKDDLNLGTKDYLWNILNSQKTRISTLNRLTKSFKIAHHKAIDVEAVAELSAIITLGKGEVISPENYPLHQAIRSTILMAVREMIDFALKTGKHEVFSDVLAVLSLYIIYVNVTENDGIYETAFPVLASNGANPIVHAKRVQALKQLAQLYNKVGFTASSYSGDLTGQMLDEAFKLFPDISDIKAYVAADYDKDGLPILDMNALSYIKESATRFDDAKEVFKSILPNMFQGYVKEVIASLKKQTGAEILLPSMFDDLTGTNNLDGKQEQLFANLTVSFLGDGDKIKGMNVIVENPESKSELPPMKMITISTKTLQKFLMSQVFSGVELMYAQSISLRSAYDTVFASLGTPTGSLVPGVGLELEEMASDIRSDVPQITDINAYNYPVLNQRYAWPLFLPALAIDKRDNSQVWSLSHLKFKMFRPDLLTLRYARDGVIDSLPSHLSLNVDDKTQSHERWSWLPSSLPSPSFIQTAAFAYTPIPYNYTADCVFDKKGNKGEVMDKFMTRTGRIPTLSYMTFCETLAEYMLSGTVSHTDVASSLAGLGYIYMKEDDTQWKMIDPQLPTIYGMPSIFFRDMNEVVVADLLIKKGKVFFPNLNVEGGDRIMYDRSNRELGIGSVILVLHKSIPVSKSLRFMIQTLRNGFTVKVPFLTSLFSILTDKARELIKKEYDVHETQAKTAVDTESDVPYLEINTAFNRMLSVFQLQPRGATVIKPTAYYDQFFKKGLNLSYSDFQDAYFSKVLGWSGVVAAFPHLTMTDRFVEHHKLHLNDWLRSYAGTFYLNTDSMANFEKINVMTIAPNVIQQMTLADEEHFNTKTLDSLTEILTTYDRENKPTLRKNAVASDEASILSGMVKITSTSEGMDMIALPGEKNPKSGAVPEAQMTPTIYPLVKDQEILKNASILGAKIDDGSKGKILDDQHRIITLDKKTVVSNDDPNKAQFDNDGKLIDETGSLKGATNIQAESISLDANKKEKNINITKTDIGKGDILTDQEIDNDSSMSDDEKKKKKALMKKKQSDSDYNAKGEDLLDD